MLSFIDLTDLGPDDPLCGICCGYDTMKSSDAGVLVIVICPLGSLGDELPSAAVVHLSAIGKYVVNTMPSSTSTGLSVFPSELLDEMDTSISHIDFISASSTSYVVDMTVHRDASDGALLQPAFQQMTQYILTKKASHTP